jgi:hypothetical protein
MRLEHFGAKAVEHVVRGLGELRESIQRKALSSGGQKIVVHEALLVVSRSRRILRVTSKFGNDI